MQAVGAQLGRDGGARSRDRARRARSPPRGRRRAGSQRVSSSRGTRSTRRSARRRRGGCACRPRAPRAGTSAPSPAWSGCSSPSRGWSWCCDRSARTWKTPTPPHRSSGLTTICAALLRQEVAQPHVRARHQRRRDQRRELEDGELLVGLAQPARIVDEERLAARVLEDQRGEVVGLIERRILAHQHRVVGAERAPLAACERDAGKPGAIDRRHPRDDRGRLAALELEVLGAQTSTSQPRGASPR